MPEAVAPLARRCAPKPVAAAVVNVFRIILNRLAREPETILRCGYPKAQGRASAVPKYFLLR
jgi:hypothetical protein